MKVFNLYGKILRKNLGNIIPYIVAFFVISMIFLGNNTSSNPTDSFNETLIDVTFINNDEDTSLVSGLKEYLKNYVVYEEVDPKDVSDALFYREIYMAIIIPDNFTNDFMSGQNIEILTQTVPDAATSVSITRAINKYLNLIKLYKNNINENESIENIISYVKADLEKEIVATKSVKTKASYSLVVNFYNFLSYLFFSLIISVIGVIMLRIRKTDIRRRMSVSPYAESKINLQLMLAHIIFVFVLLIVVWFLSFLFYPKEMNSINGIIFIVNSLCVATAILSFGFLISLLIKNDNALGAAANVISLGTSFLAGAFIPQQLLGKGMLTFAHILPNYYYVSNNEKIIFLTDYSWSNISDIVINMLIQLTFALVFAILAIIVSKKQSHSEV